MYTIGLLPPCFVYQGLYRRLLYFHQPHQMLKAKNVNSRLSWPLLLCRHPSGTCGPEPRMGRLLHSTAGSLRCSPGTADTGGKRPQLPATRGCQGQGSLSLSLSLRCSRCAQFLCRWRCNACVFRYPVCCIYRRTHMGCIHCCFACLPK